jgi:hypothetical protein
MKGMSATHSLSRRGPLQARDGTETEQTEQTERSFTGVGWRATFYMCITEHRRNVDGTNAAFSPSL